jgi:hypothetical protein
VSIKTFSCLAAVVCLLCLFEPRLRAQGASCLAYPQCQSSNQWVGGCAPLLPPGVFNCGSFGWSESCEIKTYKCTRPPCPTCCSKGPATPATCGSPINLSSGNTFINQSDLSVPGLGGGLAVSRTWNSLSSGVQGLFGPGWRSTYEESVYLGDDGFMKYARADGAIWTFGFATQSPLVYLIMTPAVRARRSYSMGQLGHSYFKTTKNGRFRERQENCCQSLIATEI